MKIVNEHERRAAQALVDGQCLSVGAVGSLSLFMGDAFHIPFFATTGTLRHGSKRDEMAAALKEYEALEVETNARR